MPLGDHQPLFACLFQVDFLLTAMRQLIAARPDLKLLLMSATVDAQSLSDYFQGAIQGEAPKHRCNSLLLA